MCINIHGSPSRKYKHSAARLRAGNYTKSGAQAKVTNWNCQPVETSASVTHRRMEVDEDLVSSTMTTNLMFGEDNQKPRMTLLDGATLRLSLPLLSWTGFCGRRPIITSIGQSIIRSLWQGVWIVH